MLNLSVAGVLEKSQLSSDGVWLLLVEVAIPDSDESLRLVHNNEDITWNGYTWTAFNFKLGDVKEDNKGKPQSVPLQISNVTQTVQAYVEEYSGMTGTTVTLRVVHSQHLDNTTPELEEVFTVESTICDNKWATFSLTACDGTLQSCRDRSNESRYGGEPSIPEGGLYA
ncbi:MAG: minor tail protein [Firmicutes bacterium]|nr:minor tail protein [Bacillota bacterium]